MKRKHTIAAVCIILSIVLAVFIWNELQKEALDLKMHGAEICADGTVIQETEFQLKGYIDKRFSREGRSSVMYFEPIQFRDVSDVQISIEDHLPKNIPVHLINFEANNYHAFTSVYNTKTDGWDDFTLYLSADKCCCVILLEDRYFVGSTNPNKPVEEILGHFWGLDLVNRD